MQVMKQMSPAAKKLLLLLQYLPYHRKVIFKLWPNTTHRGYFEFTAVISITPSVSLDAYPGPQ